MIAVAEKKYTIRIPDELHAQMVELAERDRRSLHAEMIILMEEAVAHRAEQEVAEGTVTYGAFANKRQPPLSRKTPIRPEKDPEAQP